MRSIADSRIIRLAEFVGRGAAYSMRQSVIMLAVIAFILAGAAAFLVKVFLEKQSQPVVVQQEETRPQGVSKILVASRNINPGEILSSKDVTWAEWPKALVEDRMILESEF